MSAGDLTPLQERVLGWGMVAGFIVVSAISIVAFGRWLL